MSDETSHELTLLSEKTRTESRGSFLRLHLDYALTRDARPSGHVLLVVNVVEGTPVVHQWDSEHIEIKGDELDEVNLVEAVDGFFQSLWNQPWGPQNPSLQTGARMASEGLKKRPAVPIAGQLWRGLADRFKGLYASSKVRQKAVFKPRYLYNGLSEEVSAVRTPARPVVSKPATEYIGYTALQIDELRRQLTGPLADSLDAFLRGVSGIPDLKQRMDSGQLLALNLLEEQPAILSFRRDGSAETLNSYVRQILGDSVLLKVIPVDRKSGARLTSSAKSALFTDDRRMTLARPWNPQLAKQALDQLAADLQLTVSQAVVLHVDGALVKGLDEVGMAHLMETVKHLSSALNIHLVFDGSYGDLSASIEGLENPVHAYLASIGSSGRLQRGDTGMLAEAADSNYLPFTLAAMAEAVLARSDRSAAEVLRWMDLVGISMLFGKIPTEPTAQAMASVDANKIQLLVESPILARLTRSELLELFRMTLEAVSVSA